MKEVYETICRKAGISTEATKEITRFFDADYHRLQYRKKQRQDSNLHEISLSTLFTSDNNLDYEYDLVDESSDVEEKIIHSEELDRLSSILQRLSASDRELLLTVYSGKRNNRCELAAQRGISTRMLQRRVQELFTRVKNEFLADEPDDDSISE